MRGRWRVLLLATACLFSSSIFARQCPSAPETPRVKRSFKLTVLDTTKAPEAGVKVVLGTVDRYRALHPVSNGVTDQDGVLNFVNLKAGEFTLQFTDRSGDRQRYIVQIADGGEASVEYHWPYVNWIPLRSASGILRHDSEPMRHYQVTLEGYPDGNDMGVSDTDVQGRFDLPATRPGRYYVGLSIADSRTGTPRNLGRIPISVSLDDDPVLTPDSIFVDENACGLVYDQFCTQPAAKMESWCIRTVDASEGAIANASVTLQAQHGSVGSTRLTSDEKGNVRVPNLAGGDYELQVFAKGFTPVRRIVTIVPGLASCNTATVIPMNTFGSGCAPATQGKGN